MGRPFTGLLGTRLTALAAGLLVGGCTAVGPNFKRPEVPWLAGWSSGPLDSLTAEQRGLPDAQTVDWWRNFHDPVLDRLVAEAQRVNPDVRTAGMRILEARAQLLIAGSLLYPQQQQANGSILRTGQVRSSGEDVALTSTNGGLGLGEALSSGRNVALTAYSAGLGVGWEIDFWGKFRRSIEAADAGYFASTAQYDDLQVLMAAQVANSYCAIRTIELRLKIAHENATLQKRSLEITERLFKHGDESELDVQQAKAQYLGTLSTIPQLEGSLRQNQNALGVLLARPPGPLPEIVGGNDIIPQAELGVIVDLPGDLLRRRPDVRAVEMQLAAQSALIGVKKADFYPSIALLGSLGLSATSLAGSPRTFAWGVGPSLVWNVFDHGRLSGEVLVQDARFQQLYEQYQAAVLKAAREVDDAAVGFATNRAQIPILKDAVNAAQRSLAIASIQYQEGISDFQRVLDTQRTLFSQQELLVSTISNVTLSLIALYKAMGGGWQQGRDRPLVDDATRATMSERSNWQDMLAAPLPPPAPTSSYGTNKAMGQELAEKERAALTVDPGTPKPGKGTRAGTIVVLLLIFGSLLWYFAADRLTPHSSQARVQAFIVPVAAEVSGKVLAVRVKNNDDVHRDQPLFDIDPSQYKIALQRSRADYESVRRSVNASVATVEAARASLQAAQANRVKADKDATRQEALYAEDRGAISVRRLEIVQATRIEARSKEQAAEADLRKAQEAAGDAGDDNAQLRSAGSAIEKAELDLARTKVVAPASGLVTDLRTDVGHFAQAGAPAMTLIAIHDLWINADMTENNLGNIGAGDEVAIVLDVLPGEVLKGRVRSIGYGVSSGQDAPPGTLPTIQNSRDWLRQAQRFPVAIEFDAADAEHLRKVRIGGQAEVLVFTGDNVLMNMLGRAYIHLKSWLSYLY